MLKVTCRPISTYPAPITTARRRAPFHRKRRDGLGTERTTLSDALGLLNREVQFLGARELIIEADFTEWDIRQDGWPRADARKPATPRVVLSLPASRHGPLRYPCDAFDRWEDNLLAIGRSLEALRMVDRYGVTRRGEQYAGWKSLPATTEDELTVDAAARVISRLHTESGTEAWADAIKGDPEHAKAAIRSALRRTHPDTGGTAAAFVAVQRARAVLAAHHKFATV